jgi:hypothetical protein
MTGKLTSRPTADMADLTIVIPLALTLAQIARANPAIGEDEARELAQETHSIIAAVQADYAAHPPDKARLAARLPTADRGLPYEAAIAFELGDLIDSIRGTICGHWPTDPSETSDLSCWLAVWLTDLDASGILYIRYLRVHDRVQGTDFATDLINLEKDVPGLRH